MPSLTRRPSSSQQSSTRDSGSSHNSTESNGSQFTAATSVHTSPKPSGVKTSRSHSSTRSHASVTSRPKQQQEYSFQGADVGLGTCFYPRASIDTYSSSIASERESEALGTGQSVVYQDSSIPPLPPYLRDVVEPNVRPASPQDFARLFPSLNRLSIRHDEYTSDGNMNLRIDTVVTGRRRTAIQLFHLRMYDLAKREFSMRRYCRDSGREVCNSKRQYAEPASPKHLEKKRKEEKTRRSCNKDPKQTSRPSLPRSMSSALKSLAGGSKPSLRRSSSGNSFFSSKSSPSETSKRHGSSDSRSSYPTSTSHPSLPSLSPSSPTPKPTNTIKLEFSNYARVDIRRTKHKHYDFSWWGHAYTWRRAIDHNLNQVSFHLIRDGHLDSPVAHIVPEARSPTQIYADESAGGWIPPCHMWIEDETVMGGLTDVAEYVHPSTYLPFYVTARYREKCVLTGKKSVIMATGLMALVDDCIKERWENPSRVPRRVQVPLTRKTNSFMQTLFGRRESKETRHRHMSSRGSAEKRV